MLFMGEEYGALQPFLYFCNYEGDLAKAIREGRRNEFASFGAFADEQRREQIPDPNAESTYLASQLDPEDLTRASHREWLAHTQELLSVRASKLVPLIPEIVAGAARYSVDDRMLTVSWPLNGGRALVMQANFADGSKAAPGAGDVWYSTAGAAARGDELGAWEVRLSLGTA
jgi:1,4-alpha-glucan branching enzyme